MTLVKSRADSSIMQSTTEELCRGLLLLSKLEDVRYDHHWMLCVPVYFMPWTGNTQQPIAPSLYVEAVIRV